LSIGLVASMATNRLLSAQLVQVTATDPATLTLAAVALLFAAGLGCIAPALRAGRIDPLTAMRLR
jgi:ABC-type lipoprotein release transport system permease subunit